MSFTRLETRPTTPPGQDCSDNQDGDGPTFYQADLHEIWYMLSNEKENGARLRRGTGATWTGSPKGVFAGRKHHKPRLSLDNNTAGVREREDANRTREAGNRDEVEGGMANTLNAIRYGASLLANGAAGTRAT